MKPQIHTAVLHFYSTLTPLSLRQILRIIFQQDSITATEKTVLSVVRVLINVLAT